MRKLLNAVVHESDTTEISLEDTLSDLNIAHESQLPSHNLYKGVLIEFHSMGDQIAVEEFITKLRSK